MASKQTQTAQLSGIHLDRSVPRPAPEKADPVWTRLRQDVFVTAKTEPMLAGYLHDTVLKHASLEASISYFLAGKLASVAPAGQKLQMNSGLDSPMKNGTATTAPTRTT